MEFLKFISDKLRKAQSVYLQIAIVSIPGIILLLAIQVYFGSWMARFEGMMNVPLATLQMFFTVLLCGLSIAQFVFFTSFPPVTSRSPRWIVPGGTLLIGIILLSIATFNSGFSAAHPRPADLMPAPGHPDYTIVKKQLTLPI